MPLSLPTLACAASLRPRGQGFGLQMAAEALACHEDRQQGRISSSDGPGLGNAALCPRRSVAVTAAPPLLSIPKESGGLERYLSAEAVTQSVGWSLGPCWTLEMLVC